MSHSRTNKKLKRSNRHPYENKSTQTERERPSNPTGTINGSVILKVTDYTKLEVEDSRSSIEETSISDNSSQCSAFSHMRRRSKAPLVSVTNCASQTDKERHNSILLDTYESASDSDDTDQMSAKSYDYLEGERLVTSLAELPLSDSEEDAELHSRDTANNENKLAKFI